MPRKKKVEEPQPTIYEQTEEYLRQLLTEFELVSGMRVERVEVTHKKKIGFDYGQKKSEMKINIITE
jgi:hypothetical protein